MNKWKDFAEAQINHQVPGSKSEGPDRQMAR